MNHPATVAHRPRVLGKLFQRASSRFANAMSYSTSRLRRQYLLHGLINLSKRFDAEGLPLTLRTPYGVIWARRAVYPADAVAIFALSVSMVSPDVINMKRPCISPLMWAFPLNWETWHLKCMFFYIPSLYCSPCVYDVCRRDTTRKRTSFCQFEGLAWDRR